MLENIVDITKINRVINLPRNTPFTVLSHGEAEHTIVTGISGTFVDDQVLGVNIETVAGLDGHEDHQEEADPLHDEDTEDDHSLITITEA